MEEIFPLLIGLAVWVLAAFFDSKKEKSATSEGGMKETPYGEQFPTIEILNEALEEEKLRRVQNAKSVSTSENLGGIMSQLLSKSNKNEKKKAGPSLVKKEEGVKEQDRKNRRYSMTGKSEAKRAFIYSEIFNRKY